MKRQIIKFSITGLLNTIIDFSVLNFLIGVLSWAVLPANTISFSVAVINSYFLNKYWTFRDKQPVHIKQFSIFIVVSLVGLGLSNILVYLGLEVFKVYTFGLSFVWHYNIAKAISALIVLVWNFLASKFWVFYAK